jgi:hypothetical protein
LFGVGLLGSFGCGWPGWLGSFGIAVIPWLPRLQRNNIASITFVPVTAMQLDERDPELAYWIAKFQREFCQDPETGLLCGSEPGAGGSESSGGGKTGGGGKAKVKVDSLQKFRSDGVQVHASSEEKFLEIWNDKVGMAPADFKKSFMGDAEGKMTVELRTFNLLKGPKGKPAKLVQEHYIQVHGKLTQEGTKVLGEFTRTIDPKKSTASSDSFELTKEAQAKGLGKQLLAGNIATYREMGSIKKVVTHANIDVGGYAWAKYGYVPEKAAWSGKDSQLRAQLQRRFDAIPAHLAADKPMLAKIINSKDPKAIWALADSAYGKYFLLGSSWHGDLVFSDKDSMARFDAYVGKKSTSKSFRVVRANPPDPPKGSKDPKSKEFFYIDDDGVAQDAELHNAILDEGDDEAAKKISDAVMARILGEDKEAKAAEIAQWIAALRQWGIIGDSDADHS